MAVLDLTEQVKPLQAALDELRKEREALQRELEGRVCRGCHWLDGYRCKMHYYLPHTWSDKFDVCVCDEPQSANDSMLINDPDDFGCNKWRARG